MRDIRFRAWAKYGEMFSNVQNHINGDWAFGNMLNKPDEFVIMQYTGLKDKNGVEIYEGDIIKVVSNITTDIFLVEIHMGNTSYCSKPNCPLGSVYPTMITMTKEVIGNIYENPELLKEDTYE